MYAWGCSPLVLTIEVAMQGKTQSKQINQGISTYGALSDPALPTGRLASRATTIGSAMPLWS